MGRQSLKQVADTAWEFFRLKEKHDESQKVFDDRKKAFYETMGDYFARNGGSSARFDNGGIAGAQLVVKKIEKVSIEWDAERLEKRVEKSIAKQIIKKQYRISDMQGLVQYLRGCGVDPTIFKKFILVDKTVDEKAVDRLGDIGQLTAKQISGCYVVKSQKPYFTVSVKKDDGDGEW